MRAGYIDSHCHLADPTIQNEVPAMISRAQARGIEHFLQGGVGPEDWQKQKELRKQFPGIWLCFGLHPYWVADHEDSDCESAMDALARELASPDVLAVGEMGLDLRPQIAKDSFSRQVHFFELQMELAEMAQKPVVLHLVRAFEETERIFQFRGQFKRGGMVHSFNGSTKQAEAYLNLGLHLSVGGPVVRPENQRLHQAVRAIPLEKLLIETDSPDQPPPRFSQTFNEPESLWDVAEMIGKLKGLGPEEILDISGQNLRKLLRYGNQSEL